MRNKPWNAKSKRALAAQVSAWLHAAPIATAQAPSTFAHCARRSLHTPRSGRSVRRARVAVGGRSAQTSSTAWASLCTSHHSAHAHKHSPEAFLSGCDVLMRQRLAESVALRKHSTPIGVISGINSNARDQLFRRSDATPLPRSSHCAPRSFASGRGYAKPTQLRSLLASSCDAAPLTVRRDCAFRLCSSFEVIPAGIVQALGIFGGPGFRGGAAASRIASLPGALTFGVRPCRASGLFGPRGPRPRRRARWGCCCYARPRARAVGFVAALLVGLTPGSRWASLRSRAIRFATRSPRLSRPLRATLAALGAGYARAVASSPSLGAPATPPVRAVRAGHGPPALAMPSASPASCVCPPCASPGGSSRSRPL